MMRLIDGDALKSKAFGRRGGLIHTADIDAIPTADMSCDGCKWEGTYGYDGCSYCMRGYDDMWEAKENETDRR